MCTYASFVTIYISAIQDDIPDSFQFGVRSCDEIFDSFLAIDGWETGGLWVGKDLVVDFLFDIFFHKVNYDIGLLMPSENNGRLFDDKAG